MNILITGAYGFVGRNLSAYLASRGHHLIALDVAKQELSAYSGFYSWEELDRIPWGEVDAVIHLAGKAHDTKNASDPQSYFDVNVGLTRKVVSALVRYCESALVGRGEVLKCESSKVREGEEKIGTGENEHRGAEGTEGSETVGSGQSANGDDVTNELPHDRTTALRKFILFSSVKAVADRVEGVLTEDAVPDPKTPYGQSKLEAEGAVRSSLVHYCESALVEDRRSEVGIEPLNQTAGRLNPETSGPAAMEPASVTNELMNSRTNALLYYILRPCMIHGPGNKGNLNLLYGIVSKGLPWPLGGFENRRSFASIENVCAVVEGLLTGNVKAGVYQVADDEPLSTNELIGLMSETLGRRARVWKIPSGWVRAMARIGDVLRLPLNSERLKKLTESYVVSNVKLKRALGWEKMPVSTREGMRKTVESFGNRR